MFSPGGGEQVTESILSLKDWVEIAVIDGGPGIPPEEMIHLFERFRQVGREETKQQGMGLGLTIAWELICTAARSLWRAYPERESSFTVRLPVAET